MAPRNATRRPGGGVSAVTSSMAKTSATENSIAPINGQASANRRCPGCTRQCRKLVSVHGWHTGRETPLCKRCASGLILSYGRIIGLKPGPLGARS
jgi:hypothetical protein